MVGEVKWIQKMQGGRANDSTEVTNATEGGREGGSRLKTGRAK